MPNLINFEYVTELLGGEDAHLKEFCEAGIGSFTKFRDEYRAYLLNRDLESLRKTGHRIRPVAQMLSVEEINEEYERSKQLLANGASDKKLQNSVHTVEAICNEIIAEFREKIKNLDE